jgi:predicted transcriptional regulator
MTVLQALEIMKTHVVTVQLDSTLGDAIDRMDLYQVDELVVVDGDGRLCGMLCEHDVANTVANTLVAHSQSGDIKLANTLLLMGFIVQDIPKVLDTDSITEDLIRAILATHRRIPVVDDNHIVVGTLNRVDIIQALFEGTIQIP